jgi:hypothetical protein
VIKSTKISFAGYVHEREGGAAHTGFWLGNSRERDHLEETGVVGRMIFKQIFKVYDRGRWTCMIWIRRGEVAVSCEQGNEPSSSVKYREFFVYVGK